MASTNYRKRTYEQLLEQGQEWLDQPDDEIIQQKIRMYMMQLIALEEERHIKQDHMTEAMRGDKHNQLIMRATKAYSNRLEKKCATSIVGKPFSIRYNVAVPQVLQSYVLGVVDQLNKQQGLKVIKRSIAYNDGKVHLFFDLDSDDRPPAGTFATLMMPSNSSDRKMERVYREFIHAKRSSIFTPYPIPSTCWEKADLEELQILLKDDGYYVNKTHKSIALNNKLWVHNMLRDVEQYKATEEEEEEGDDIFGGGHT